MSDTTPRNPVSAPQMIADALLRSVAGTKARLRVTGSNSDTNQAEVGLISTSFSEIEVSPVVMRKLRPPRSGAVLQWELLVSATSVQAQVDALDVSSARELFAMTLAVTVDGDDYLIDSVSSNEAFGEVYLYRLLLSQAARTSI
jgi:hypothetical protein